MTYYDEEKARFIELAKQQAHNYKILFPCLAKGAMMRYEMDDISYTFIDFVRDICVEAAPDHVSIFNHDARILRDSLSNKRDGNGGFKERFKYIDDLITSVRNIDNVDSFNTDIVKFYNYCVENKIEPTDEEFIGICAYLNANPSYAAEKMLDISDAHKRFLDGFDL